MTISIIIPYFKNAKEIKRSLMSVFKQTYQNFEVLIINDASPDWEEALPIIKSFSDTRITTISHAINKNGAAARNTGIKAAKGAYIAFLDADDEWEVNHIITSLKTLSKAKADLSYSRCKMITKPPYIIMPRVEKRPNETISDYLFVAGEAMYTPAIIMKTEVANQNLFNENLRRHQDYDFLLRLENKNYKICYNPHQTVIVHWENNDIRKKGGTWDFSLQFAIDYKKYFTPKAFSRFILQFVVLPNIEEKNNFKSLSLIVKYINLFHLSKLNYYFILSYFLFGELKHPYKRKQ